MSVSYSRAAVAQQTRDPSLGKLRLDAGGKGRHFASWLLRAASDSQRSRSVRRRSIDAVAVPSTNEQLRVLGFDIRGLRGEPDYPKRHGARRGLWARVPDGPDEIAAAVSG
jgi:hypothetical protein